MKVHFYQFNIKQDVGWFNVEGYELILLLGNLYLIWIHLNKDLFHRHKTLHFPVT